MNIGTVSASYHSPHVYFIFSKDVLYIGETQVIPVRRWSTHLDKGGSFFKKLIKHLDGESEFEYLNSLSFFSIPCKDILNTIMDSYCGYRIPTQALEHKLHEMVMTQYTFGNAVKVISETTKTTPKHFGHWKEIDKIAEACLEKILLYKEAEELPFKL